MNKIELVLCDMVQSGIIPKNGTFDVTELMIDEYYNVYHNKFSKTTKENDTHNLRYAKKLAGINLMKLNIARSNDEAFDEVKLRVKKPKCGLIYIISNPAFPNMYKVGMTQDLEKRLRQYQTGDPYRRYKIEHYKFVMNAREEEKKFLEQFNTNIVHGEWISSEEVKEMFYGPEA